jgi:hypothetical protein
MVFWLVVTCGFETSCGSGGASGDTRAGGAADANPTSDAPIDSDGSLDTGQSDANLDASVDTGAADTSAADTSAADASVDTGAADTSAADASVDTGAADTGPGEVTYGWDPYVRHACYRALGTVDPRYGPDCATSTGAWAFGTTNENAAFTGGGPFDIPFGHPIWTFGFYDDPSGHYTVGWAIDKVNFDYFRDRYSFAGFDDTSLNVPLAGDVRLSLQLEVKDAEQYDDGVNGMAKNRIMIGAVGTWNGRSHYLEVNLWRTDNFDLCTGACDPSNVYDRKFGDPAWPAEGVYFHGPSLGSVPGYVSQPNLTIGGGVKDFEVHLSSLFRGYTGWTDPPANWAQASLTGIYIGIEVWGRGRVWIEHKEYRVWSPS